MAILSSPCALSSRASAACTERPYAARLGAGIEPRAQGAEMRPSQGRGGGVVAASRVHHRDARAGGGDSEYIAEPSQTRSMHSARALASLRLRSSSMKIPSLPVVPMVMTTV